MEVNIQLIDDINKYDHDKFHSETNLKHIRQSIEQLKQGKVVIKTIEELVRI